MKSDSPLPHVGGHHIYDWKGLGLISVWEEVGCILNIVYLKGNKGFEILDVEIGLMANHRERSEVPN